MSMAKKMISRLSVLAVLMVFLAACSKQTEYTKRNTGRCYGCCLY